MSLDTITIDNWKQFAGRIAKEKFPVDSLVAFRYPMQDSFGKVTRILPSGRVYVLRGELETYKCEIVGPYREIDYVSANFIPRPSLGVAVLRFYPGFDEEDKEIEWCGASTLQYATLRQLVPNKQGLVHDSVLDY